jgi:hypothetical protein
MKVSEAVSTFIEYHSADSKKNTLKNYEFVAIPFRTQFGVRELDTITPDEILPFLINLTNGAKQSTKKLRYANLKAFFNFIRNTFNPTLENPCEATMLNAYRSCISGNTSHLSGESGITVIRIQPGFSSISFCFLSLCSVTIR